MEGRVYEMIIEQENETVEVTSIKFSRRRLDNEFSCENDSPKVLHMIYPCGRPCERDQMFSSPRKVLVLLQR